MADEAGAVLQTMGGGVKIGAEIAKYTFELMLRFINFIIVRYEKSKEFNMKYKDMNVEQKRRRDGYVTAKQMKKEMERTGEGIIPVSMNKELTESEKSQLERYAKMMKVPILEMQMPMVDEQGNAIMEENGLPKTKTTYFVLQNDMDKMNMILMSMNKDKQHENIENSNLSEEQKTKMHKDVDSEYAYGDNEETVQNMTYDKTEFYEAMNKACKEKDFSGVEEMLKNENVKFYSAGEKSGFTAIMNKNARRDYAKGESYYVVDAVNPKRFIELTSERNEKQDRTDTTYKVYKDDLLVYATDDKISDEVAKQNNGWNPSWTVIRENIAMEGNFKEDGHYFIFNNKEEFSTYKELFENSIKQFTIEPQDISVNMDYSKLKSDIDVQMQTNSFYKSCEETLQISSNSIKADISRMDALQKIAEQHKPLENALNENKELFNRYHDLASKLSKLEPQIHGMGADSIGADTDIFKEYEQMSKEFVSCKENVEPILRDAMEQIRIPQDEVKNMSTIDKIDYQLFVNNMEQKTILNKMESLASNIEAKKMEFSSIDLDNPIIAMEQNQNLSNELDGLVKQQDLYSKYLEQLAGEENNLLSSHAEEITEAKATNKEASKILTNYRAGQKMKESNISVKGYSKEQKAEIKQGLANGLSAEQVKSYMNMDMSVEEMQIRRKGLEAGLKNTDIEHATETFAKSNNLSLADDVMTAYKAGLNTEQVNVIADSKLTNTERGQLIEACKAGVDLNKLQSVKEDIIKNPLTESKTSRVNNLLQVANDKNIMITDLNKISAIKDDKAVGEINKALQGGLSMKELEPVLQESISAEQVKGIVEILMEEKKTNKTNVKAEKTPSKEQFKQAHQWANQQNKQNDKSMTKDMAKETAHTTKSADAR